MSPSGEQHLGEAPKLEAGSIHFAAKARQPETGLAISQQAERFCLCFKHSCQRLQQSRALYGGCGGKPACGRSRPRHGRIYFGECRFGPSLALG